MSIVPEVEWTAEDREIIWARLYRLYAQGAYQSLDDYIEARRDITDSSPPLDRAAYTCCALSNKRFLSMPRYDEGHGWHSISSDGFIGVSVRLGALKPI